MAIQAGTAYIPVKADMSDFGRDVESGTQQADGKIKGFAKSAGAALAGAFVVDKAFDFFGSAVAGARESAKVMAQTEQVIKTTGGAAQVTAGHVADYAGKLAGLTGVDDEVIQSGQNLLLTFTNVQNRVGEGNDIFDRATQTALDMSVAFGQDMSSSSIQLGKALNDPIKGITALSRVGVSFTEQQKEQIKAMQAAGDTAGAQKVILDELAKQVGGSAEAQATSTGKMAVAWGNFQETIGALLIPVIDRLLEILTKVATWASENTPVVAALGAVVGTALVAAFVAWAISAASAAVATIAAAAPVIALGVAIAALIAGAIYVWTHWDEIWGWIQDKVSDVFDAVVGFVQELPGRALNVLRSAWGVYWSFWTAIFTAAKDFVSDRVADIVGFVSGLAQRAKDVLAAAWHLYWDYYIGAWQAAATFVFDRVADVVGFVAGLPQKAKDGLLATWHFYSDFWIGVFQAAADFVSARIDDVVSWFAGLPARMVAAVEFYIDLIRGLGDRVVRWLLQGLKAMATGAGGLLEWFGGLPGLIADKLAEGVERIVGLGRAIVERIIEGIKSVASGIGGAILDAIPGGDAIGGALSHIPGVGDGPGRPSGGNTLARVQAVLPRGLYVTSTYRTPAENRRVGGSPTSYHLDRSNPAVDIGGPTRLLDAFADRLRAMGGWRELLWRVKGHWDHVHVAHTGGHVTPQGIRPLRADELLTTLQHGETVLPKGVTLDSDLVAEMRAVRDELRRQSDRLVLMVRTA